MKKTALSLMFAMIGILAFAQSSVVTSKNPETEASASWETQSFDFGKVKLGIPVTHEFKFVNTGKTPLILSNVTASCGCTTPLWSKEPIMPGQSGFVKATFNAGSLGVFDKTVTVTSNLTDGIVQLKIKGEVAEQIVQ